MDRREEEKLQKPSWSARQGRRKKHDFLKAHQRKRAGEMRPASLANSMFISVEQEGCNCGRREVMFSLKCLPAQRNTQQSTLSPPTVLCTTSAKEEEITQDLGSGT